MTTHHSPYSRTQAPGRIVVGVGELAVSADPTSALVTYALGSCIGVTVFDPVAKVGGLLHFMLPAADLSPEKAASRPAMFGDTGIPMLFRACYHQGAAKERLVVCAAGGAEVINDGGHFQIGQRNRTVLRKLFWKNGILLAADDTGGSHSRTLTLDLSDGSVTVRSSGADSILWHQTSQGTL